MKARIKRFDKQLPLPEYKTSGAAGFDLCARERMTIAPHEIGYVPLNVAIEPPKGFFVLLAARSSLHRKGLMCVNGVGIVDRDYSGNEDEYKAVLYNYTDKRVVVEAGDRLMQGVFVPHIRVTWTEVDKMKNETRGGFGSTGSR